MDVNIIRNQIIVNKKRFQFMLPLKILTTLLMVLCLFTFSECYRFIFADYVGNLIEDSDWCIAEKSVIHRTFSKRINSYSNILQKNVITHNCTEIFYSAINMFSCFLPNALSRHLITTVLRI
jgi:hypothetical protein